ncbi:BnaA05g18190D [Brassica napus]|uniref:BnaA05g18190D protein n=2 Tax=Brassica TaxID=3705 RepID=A0A078GSA8_BRANA|nr:BnaA05g18190D [Brassica napus]
MSRISYVDVFENRFD